MAHDDMFFILYLAGWAAFYIVVFVLSPVALLPRSSGGAKIVNKNQKPRIVPAVTELGRKSMFDTHKLNEKGFDAVKQFKSKLSHAVTEAMLLIPEGREKAVFKTKVEEAVFFGTKGIASSPENHTEVITY